jgi:hypothetical protein
LIVYKSYLKPTKSATMKLSYTIASLLSAVATATPIANPEPIKGDVGLVAKGFSPYDIKDIRDTDAMAAGLAARATVVCKIVNVVTTVGCRYNPWHAGWNGKGVSEEVIDFPPSGGHDFSCYQIGECIEGNWSVF